MGEENNPKIFFRLPGDTTWKPIGVAVEGGVIETPHFIADKTEIGPIKFNEPITITCTADGISRELLKALRGKKIRLPRKLKKGAYGKFGVDAEGRMIYKKSAIYDKGKTKWQRKAIGFLQRVCAKSEN